MTANDRLVLFAVSMVLVGIIGLILWLNRVVELRRLRKGLSRETAVQKLCNGSYFNLGKLLEVCQISPVTRDVQNGTLNYSAVLKGKRCKIRITLKQINDLYYLERVERYRDANWQFEGWYDGYRHKHGESSARYIATGAANLDEAERTRRLPGFMLTRDAVACLVGECTTR